MSMNISTVIEVITVVSNDANVVFQSIHVNDHEAAVREYTELQERNADLLREGGTITRRRF